MNDREIVVFRYRRGLRVGAVEEDLGDKVRLKVEKGKAFSVPRENVVLECGAKAKTQGELDGFLRRLRKRADALDLAEVWELAADGGETVSFCDIADLCESDDDPVARAAVLWHLSAGSCPYFEPEGERWAPASGELVRQRRQRAELQRLEREEDEALLGWLAGGANGPRPEEMSVRQTGWLDRIRGFAIEGDDAPGASRVKAFLARAFPDTGDPRRALFRRLVKRGVFEEHENLDLLRLDVPVEFEPEAIAQAERARELESGLAGAPPAGLGGAAIEVFSIDDETTTDIDDAFSLEEIPGGFRLGIHITDLSALVPADSPLDAAASERVTTLYFPERKIPMLPAALSENAGSLLPDRERGGVSLLVELDRELQVREVRPLRTRIVNRQRLSYDRVDAILAGQPDELRPAIETLDRLAASLEARRREAGAPALRRADVLVRVDEAGEVTFRVRGGESPAQRIVSELMILYNVEIARLCRGQEIPIIYRTQCAPDSPPPEDVHPSLRRYRYLRSCPPPDLTLEAGPHAILGVDAYCQVSSPLRRCIDLVHQRQVATWLDGREPLAAAEISMVLFRAEERLRELRRLEPSRLRYWLLRHFSRRTEEVYHGVVLEAGERQGTVELVECPFLRATLLLNEPLEPGEVVEMRIVAVDARDDVLRFRPG